MIAEFDVIGEFCNYRGHADVWIQEVTVVGAAIFDGRGKL